MHINEQLQVNLIYLRKQKRLSMERVATIINVSRQAYAAYENGISVMSIESLNTLAGFYGVTMDLMVSSALVDGRQPATTFSTFIPSGNNSYINIDEPLLIRNINASLIVVKIDDLNFKFFESTITYIEGQEQLFELDGKYYFGKLYYNDDGSGFFITNNNVTKFSKKQAKTIVVIGLLLANMKKEYELEDFL